VVVPRGSPNERVAKAVGYQVADTLVAAGVRRSAIDFRSYTAGPGENAAPVRIAYAAITAKAAPCGPWTDQSARTGENRHYGAYGCAAQNNLAAIVSNPLDLLYPRGTTPPDAERRSTVLDNYRNGDPTQGDYSREAGGAVAQGVGD
jgi:pilus assembly protein CpaD